MKSFLSTARERLVTLNNENLKREQKIRSEKWKVEDEVLEMLDKADTEMFDMQVGQNSFAILFNIWIIFI